MAGNRVTVKQGLIEIVADTTNDDTIYAPQEVWALPANLDDTTIGLLLNLELEKPNGVGRTGVRVGLTRALPGVDPWHKMTGTATKWQLEYCSYQGELVEVDPPTNPPSYHMVYTEPIPLVWTIEDIQDTTSLNNLYFPLPLALFRARLVATEPGKYPVRYPESTIETPEDEAWSRLLDITKDGKLSDGPEKFYLMMQWRQAQAEYQVILDSIPVGSNISTTDYEAYYKILEDHAYAWTTTGTVDVSKWGTEDDTYDPPTSLVDMWLNYLTEVQSLRAQIARWSTGQLTSNLAIITAIQADGVLKKSEKEQITTFWLAEEAIKATLDSEADSLWGEDCQERVAYDSAYADLAAKEEAWLGGITYPLNDDVDISGWSPTLLEMWTTYWNEKATLQAAIQAKIIDSIKTLLAQLAGITSDGILSLSEMPVVRAWWNTAVAEKPGLDAMADAAGITTEKTIYDGYYADLDDIKGLWADTVTEDQDISTLSPTFYTRWSDYWSAKAELQRTLTDVTLTTLAAIASDNIISKGEKPVVLARWNAAQGDWETLSDRARALGVGYGFFSTAYYSLQQIILTCDLEDFTEDTPIDGTTFYQCWVDFDTAKTQLQISLQSSTPSISAATMDATSLTGVGNLVVDGSTITDGEKVLLADETDHSQNGVYVCHETSGASPSTIWGTSLSGDTSEVTDASNVTDESLSTAGILSVPADTERLSVVIKTVIIGGFSGDASSGDLTFKVQAFPGAEDPAYGKVLVDYSTDSGTTWNCFKWYKPRLGNDGITLGTGVSCNTDGNGVDTLTVALSGVIMANLRIRVMCYSGFKSVGSNGPLNPI